MELSKTVASIAVVLGMILAAGYAQGGESIEKQAVVLGVILAAGQAHAQAQAIETQVAPAGPTKPTAQDRIQEREAQRRAAVLEQERRKVAYERACNKPLKTEADLDLCRTAYKRLHLK